MNHIFVNPQTLEKIQAKVERLAKRWQYDSNDLHTLWQMVATIEAGFAEKTFYDKGGIIVDGWNGYRNFDNPDTDPKRAWGGFYRQEKAQMVGWSLYMLQNADNKIDQANRCTNAYGYWFVWEDEPMVWGYNGWQDFYTEEEAREFLATQTGKHIKRTDISYSDMSGCWRVKVETTKCKPNTKTVYKQRIAA